MKTRTNNTPDVYQIITDRLIALLEAGTTPWRKPWNGGGDPANLVTRREYNGINHFLLSASSYASPYWLTFKQAQVLGGHVRKNEKGTPVIFWKLLDKDSSEEKIPLLRYYTVFNLEQCEGVAVPAGTEPKTYEHDPIETAEAVQLAMPNRPVVNIKQSGRAFYSPTSDSVTIPELSQYERPEEFYCTLFHELAHATGHQSRLNREGITGHHYFGDREYSKEELVAEMTASFLCGYIGIDTATINNSAAYIQGWIKKLRGDKKLAVIAAAQATKAANYILNRKPQEEE